MESHPNLPSHFIPVGEPMGEARTIHGLPFQTFGFGHFENYSPWSLMVSCPENMTPMRLSDKAAGYELRSPVKIVIPARGSAVINTQCKVVLPSCHYGKIEGLSRLALKHDVVAFGGVIDEDNRDDIHVKLFNHSDTPYVVETDDRIAQLVIQGYANLNIRRVSSHYTRTGFGPSVR